MDLLLLGSLIVACYLALRRDIKSVKPTKRNGKKKNEESGPEMVYILANPSFRSGLFKIGLTKRDVNTRMRELFTTGVPTPYVQCMVLVTDNCTSLERYLHDKFSDKRVNSRREWFNLTEEDLAVIANEAHEEGYLVRDKDLESIQRALQGA
jgi:hypothetical protein